MTAASDDTKEGENGPTKCQEGHKGGGSYTQLVCCDTMPSKSRERCRRGWYCTLPAVCLATMCKIQLLPLGWTLFCATQSFTPYGQWFIWNINRYTLSRTGRHKHKGGGDVKITLHFTFRVRVPFSNNGGGVSLSPLLNP